jgi:8-oxo-dGTP pyrophosphatase MutT (NUDIX family)
MPVVLVLLGKALMVPTEQTAQAEVEEEVGLVRQDFLVVTILDGVGMGMQLILMVQVRTLPEVEVQEVREGLPGVEVLEVWEEEAEERMV